MTIPATLAVSVSFFAATVGAHLLICIFSGTGKFMLKGLLTGFTSLLAAAAWGYRAGAVDIISLYIILTLWLAYMMFFINLLNSVTLKMLARLAEEPGGELTEPAFQGIFNEETGIRLRLEDMRANGFIKLEGEDLRLTAKARLLLAAVFLIRKIFSVDVVG